MEDIRDVRSNLAREYASMPKDAALALQNERVEEELRKIAQFRFITRSIDVCPNDLNAKEHFQDIFPQGRKQVVGRPILYGTSKEFLIHFGLNSLADLPTLEEFAQLAEAQTPDT